MPSSAPDPSYNGRYKPAKVCRAAAGAELTDLSGQSIVQIRSETASLGLIWAGQSRAGRFTVDVESGATLALSRQQGWEVRREQGGGWQSGARGYRRDEWGGDEVNTGRAERRIYSSDTEEAALRLGPQASCLLSSGHTCL